jgi:hypothetical protein
MAKNKLKVKQEKKTVRPWVVVMGTLLVVLIVAVGILIYIVLSDRGAEPVERERPVIGGRGTVVTEDNLDDILAEMGRPIEDASYLVSMSMVWEYDRWDRPLAVAVDNYIDNTRTVYFDVFLNDENGEAMYDELIFSSPYMEVGTEIRNFALDKHVPAGNHTATVVFYLVDEDHNVLTDVSVGIRLNIKN